MATTITAYNHLSELLAKKLLDLSADTIKVALVDSGYVFSAAHTVWADASADELAAGAGYVAGGETLAGLSITLAGAQSKWDANDVTWAAATLTCRRAIAYLDATVGGKVKPLLFSILFDDTPADVSVAGVDFQIIWAAGGIGTIG